LARSLRQTQSKDLLSVRSAKPFAPQPLTRPLPTRPRHHRTSPHSLTLVPKQQRHSPLALWHLLSLDAPTVATLWTYFVASCSGVALPWTSPAAIFLAVWMLYAADRLLDARTPSHDLEERHRFHHRHRRAFLPAIAIASILLTCLIPTLNPAALRLSATLASLLFAYFFLIHIHPAGNRLPKELAVGLFFPAAIFIPTVARSPHLRLALAPTALLFAAVCTLNCLYLYAWEHPGPRASAHWTTRFATQHVEALSLLVIATSICSCLLWVVIPAGNLRLLPLACTLSATLLLTLHRQHAYLSRIHLRAAADLALLTPLLLLRFTHVFPV